MLTSAHLKIIWFDFKFTDAKAGNFQNLNESLHQTEFPKQFLSRQRYYIQCRDFLEKKKLVWKNKSAVTSVSGAVVAAAAAREQK